MTQCDSDNGCVACKGTADTKANPLQLSSESTWDGLCGKAEKLKALKAFTKSKDFCDLNTLMKVAEPPKKVHKICKLNISGVKYIDKS